MLKPLTVQEEMELKKLSAQFRDHLGRVITHAMKTAKNGRLEIPLPELEDYIHRAYIMGRGHA